QKLARANPGALQYEERLANAQVSRGVYLTDARRFEEGEKLIRQGLDFHQRMLVQFPSKVRYRLLVALAHRRLFELYDRNSQYEEADKAFAQARDCFERLAQQYPKLVGYSWQLAQSHNVRSSTFLARGKLQEAETEARQAIALHGKLVARFPGEVYEDFL